MRSAKSVFFLAFSILSCCILIFPRTSQAQLDSARIPRAVNFTGEEKFIILRISNPDTSVRLPHRFIIQKSERVSSDSTTLKRGIDYEIDYTAGIISFNKKGNFFQSRKDSVYSIRISYRNFPFNLPTEYTSHVTIARYDTTLKKNITMIAPSAPITPAELFGRNIQKSGSIVRGFTIGSNQDLTLNSGFRMQLSGNLTKDVSVTAALTDQSSPIQPEGNTRTLQEFDNVFVTIKSPHIVGTLGDFQLSEKGTEFGIIDRKLEGAMGTAHYGQTSVMASGAVSRGMFTTQQVAPIDGSQGPYQLVGENGNPNIVVIAGSEKVYLDGIAMVRGETNDYTIDYSNAQITFTPKHLITNLSRIFVTFEYTNGNFQRTFAGGAVSTKLVNNKLRLGISYYQEGDEPNSALGVSLADSDKALLAAAGSNRLAASTSGVTYVGRDSVSGIGKGQYSLDSLMVNGKPYYIYRFVQPTDTAGLVNAVYDVSFSLVGNGKGDYQSVGFGQYNFVGIDQGDYAPIVILPMPQFQQLADVNAQYRFNKDGAVSLEYAASSLDVNRFSSLPGVTRYGSGMKFGLAYAPRHVTIGNADIGALNFNEMTRYESADFTPMDLTNNVEFNREWGIDTLVAGNELLNQAHLDFSPSIKTMNLTIGGDVGRITRGTGFSSGRYSGTLSFGGKPGSDSTVSLIPTVNYQATLVDSRDNVFSNFGNWFRQSGTFQLQLGKFVPGFEFQSEDRRLATTGTDSMWAASYRYIQFGPTLSISQFHNLDINASLYERDESGVVGGELVPSSKSLVGQVGLQLSEWNDFNSNLLLTYRKQTYSDSFQTLGNTNTESFLSKWQTTYSPLNRGIETNLFYQVTTDRAARLQQIFWKVQPGQGQYVWVDTHHNGQVDLTDPTEFQQVNFNGDYILLTRPTTQLYPVVDLKTNIRVALTPDRFIKGNGSPVSAVLRSLSSVTLWEVSENNQTSNLSEIYLMDLSKFLNDSLTISGAQVFQQDLYILQNDRDFSLRLRFLENKSLSQYSIATERDYTRQQSVRVRTKLSDTFYEQLDVNLGRDNVYTTYTDRAHLITSSTVTSELSYRPNINVESSFKLQFSKAVDALRSGLTASMNTEELKVAYSILTKGRLTSSIERDEVSMSGVAPNVYIPYSLTQGFLPGQNYIWEIGFQYRINSFIQANADYTGRIEGGGSPIHTMTAEVRAFF